MISNSNIDKTTKSPGKFLSSKVKGQSLHTLPNLIVAPNGEIAFNVVLSAWGTKPYSHIILTATNEFDTLVLNKTLSWVWNNAIYHAKACSFWNDGIQMSLSRLSISSTIWRSTILGQVTSLPQLWQIISGRELFLGARQFLAIWPGFPQLKHPSEFPPVIVRGVW